MRAEGLVVQSLPNLFLHVFVLSVDEKFERKDEHETDPVGLNPLVPC